MIYFAPLQGYTEAFYRRAHNAIIGGVDEYVTPFLRLEKNELSAKDMSKSCLLQSKKLAIRKSI